MKMKNKGKKIALCIVIALFTASLVVGTTWSRGGGGGGMQHTSPTGECTVCHGTSLTAIHDESWSTDRTGCYICHPTGRRGLYDYLAKSYDCLSCHTPSGEPVAYHMNMDTKHTSTEAFCTQCHLTNLPTVHEDQEDYCLLCHKNPDIELPDNADCTSCHAPESYNPTLNQCVHDGVTSHTQCTNCHLTCAPE